MQKNLQYAYGCYAVMGERGYQEDAHSGGVLPPHHCATPQELGQRLWTAHHMVDSNDFGGSTAITVAVQGSYAVTATVGDSIAFVAVYDEQGHCTHVQRLNSQEHNVHNPLERARLLAAAPEQGDSKHASIDDKKGSLFVCSMKDIMGTSRWLAVTRALGDKQFNAYAKDGQQLIIADSVIDILDLSTLPAGHRTQIIVASDGLVDMLKSNNSKEAQEAYVQQALNATAGVGLLDESSITQRLIDQAKKNLASSRGYSDDRLDIGDNTTVISQTVEPGRPDFWLSVFDGHGGYEVARGAATHMPAVMTQILSLSPQEYAQHPWSVAAHLEDYQRDNGATAPYRAESAAVVPSTEAAELPVPPAPSIAESLQGMMSIISRTLAKNFSERSLTLEEIDGGLILRNDSGRETNAIITAFLALQCEQGLLECVSVDENAVRLTVRDASRFEQVYQQLLAYQHDEAVIGAEKEKLRHKQGELINDFYRWLNTHGSKIHPLSVHNLIDYPIGTINYLIQNEPYMAQLAPRLPQDRSQYIAIEEITLKGLQDAVNQMQQTQSSEQQLFCHSLEIISRTIKKAVAEGHLVVSLQPDGCAYWQVTAGSDRSINGIISAYLKAQQGTGIIDYTAIDDNTIAVRVINPQELQRFSRHVIEHQNDVTFLNEQKDRLHQENGAFIALLRQPFQISSDYERREFVNLPIGVRDYLQKYPESLSILAMNLPKDRTGKVDSQSLTIGSCEQALQPQILQTTECYYGPRREG